MAYIISAFYLGRPRRYCPEDLQSLRADNRWLRAWRGDGSQTTDFGTLSFGTLSSLYNNVDVASTSGAGSIIVTCTPGTAISIALDYGVNGGSATRRYMSNGGGNTLAYQLYQDANRANVWGNSTLALSVASFPSSTQTYTVYGRLLPRMASRRWAPIPTRSPSR